MPSHSPGHKTVWEAHWTNATSESSMPPKSEHEFQAAFLFVCIRYFFTAVINTMTKMTPRVHGLTVPEGESLWWWGKKRHNGRQLEQHLGTHILIYKQESERANWECWECFENHPQWHTSFNKAIPSNPFQTVPPTVGQIWVWEPKPMRVILIQTSTFHSLAPKGLWL